MGYKLSTPIVGFTDSNVNVKNTGATLIFTNADSTKLFFPFKIRVYGTNIVSPVTPATLSIGTNASNYNNILSSVSLTGLVTTGTFIDYLPTYPISTISAGTDVYVNVTVGASATTFGVRIAVYGDSI